MDVTNGGIADLVEAVMPAVVHVEVKLEGGSATGSGFAIAPEAADGTKGILVTNAHVVAGGQRYTVHFYDDMPIEATLRVSDPSTDVAILEVADPPPRVLELRPLTETRVGEAVIAIGSPYGITGTVTAGIISGLDRTMLSPNGMPIDNMIQTDTLINPGNSGGPLIGLDGRVIGINDQVRVDTVIGGSSGLGFAIPVETAHFVYEEICATGKPYVQRASIGARLQLRPFTAGERAQWQQKAGAMVIDAPVEDSPAAAAGLRRGDVVVALDGAVVDEPGDVFRLLNRSRIGRPCTVELVRDGARCSTVVVPVERNNDEVVLSGR